MESRLLLDAGGLLPDGTLPDPTIPPLDPGAIAGRVWEDLDGNRDLNGPETGMGGVTVYSDLNFNGILDEHEPHAVTSFDVPETDFDEGGFYRLENLQPGYHNVRQVIPAGYEQTFPSLPPGHLPPPWGDPSVHVTYVEPGQTVEGIRFGNSKLETGTVHGTKWEDLNFNGHRDPGEPGLPGVVIYSDRNLNGVLDSDEPYTVTAEDDLSTDFDESGSYVIDLPGPDLHWIREVVPEGFQQTFPNYWLFDPSVDVADLWLPDPLTGEPAYAVFVLPGNSVEGIDFGNHRIEPGSISGVKWEDTNGNAEFDPSERGLGGVTVYLDLNNNGVLDPNEPNTVTSEDIPETDFDEAGRYTLAGIRPGSYSVREVVPAGFRQTYPHVLTPLPEGETPDGSSSDGTADQFAVVQPDRLDFNLADGDMRIVEVSISVLPNVFVPIEIDVMASPAVGNVINVSGPQLNSGGGHTSTFEIHVFADGTSYSGELQFIDLAGGNVIASIPLTINHQSPQGGSHWVIVGSGQAVEGINFGNQRIETGHGWVTGRKWEDLDGNGQRDPGEPGLGGVLIYADENFNGVFDPDEPHTVTREDIPETDFDEAGLYRLELRAGTHWISEVVPLGYLQTFPSNVVIAIFPPPPGGGSHEVTLAAGQTIEGLHFGNHPLGTGTVGGRKWLDRNGNRERDPGEPGWGGVTIYADMNFNGQLDPGEPSTETTEDDPDTDFDESGFYVLQTQVGFQAIREIVPDGSYQTYPVSDALSPLEEGAHFVNVQSGQHVDGLDFGNQQLDNFPAGVSGRKWEDLNANGVWDGPEQGLGGVTIYSDLNYNGKLDENEPHTITRYDNPDTDFDEGGLYTLGDLTPGVHVIRERVPFGFVQTYPSPILAIPNSDAHTVHLGIGEFVDGLDFGNYRNEVPPPGDLNGDGVVDEKDLEYWQEVYGTPDTGTSHSDMDGQSFLLWQRNLGTGVPVAASSATDEATSNTATAVASLPAVNLVGLPLGSQEQSVTEATSRDAALEEVFIESRRSRWRPPQARTNMSTSPAQKWRGGEVADESVELLSETVDAAIESEFG